MSSTPEEISDRQQARVGTVVLLAAAIMAVLILIPSMYGFIGKFIEFVHIYRGTSGGEFAVAPIMNYLLASTGFFCMFIWATWHGMFRDVERPKIEMLANEEQLDRREAASRIH